MNEVTANELQGLQVDHQPDRGRALRGDQTNDLQLGKWLAGAAVGAIAMYMLDPQYGPARRAESRQKLRELGRQTGDVLDKVVREVGSGAGSAMSQPGTSTGSTLATVAHEAGQALKGVVERETGAPTHPDAAADSAQATRRLAGNGAADGASGSSQSFLASGYPGARPVSGMRTAALAGGGLLGLFGLFAPRSMVSTAAGLAGIALLARASSRQPLHTMFGAGTHARPVAIEKTVSIDAAPEQVYDQFANYENFPRFMSNVIQVRDLGHGRSRWIVKGPGGTEFAWTAAVTEHDRPHRLAWRSEPGAEVEQAGTITLEPQRGGTRVTVHISYRPPAGAVGKTIARLMGRDPARELEEDLERMKMLIERGTTLTGRSTGKSQAAHVLH